MINKVHTERINRGRLSESYCCFGMTKSQAVSWPHFHMARTSRVKPMSLGFSNPRISLCFMMEINSLLLSSPLPERQKISITLLHKRYFEEYWHWPPLTSIVLTQNDISQNIFCKSKKKSNSLLTVTVEQCKHHITHVIRQLYFGHRACHLLHSRCTDTMRQWFNSHWEIKRKHVPAFSKDLSCISLNTGHSFPVRHFIR